MVNKIVLGIIDKWKNEEPPKKLRDGTPTPSGLTQILQRDENGKPKLDLKPFEKTAVNTLTQEGYWSLMRVYECGGWKWQGRSEDLPTQSNHWESYKENTCIMAGVDYYQGGVYNEGIFEFSSREFFQGESWDVISTDKFYDNQKITPEMLKEINKWFGENGK